MQNRLSRHDTAALPPTARSFEDGTEPSTATPAGWIGNLHERHPMFDALRDFTANLPEFLQWLGVALAGAIPFVESYGASIIGILTGIHPAVAIIAAIIGNILSMLGFVFAAHGVRSKVRSGRPEKPETPRRAKLRARFDRYGVAGVSIIGQTILPSQITSAAMVSFGASRNAVILWQIVSIVLWGTVFGVLASFGVALLR